jgi:phosphoribosylformimino-5-aminoimidazole carboxamide ribotide isomerase
MTKFRPCIDLHQGQVKQIVGSTLSSGGSSDNTATTTQHTTTTTTIVTNFSTNQPAADYAALYQHSGLTGGHVILLDSGGACQTAARAAVAQYPGGLQIGGGVDETNCQAWLRDGASHVIITSAVFRNGQVDWERLQRIVALIGKEHLVLDLSCRRKPTEDGTITDSSTSCCTSGSDYYYVVTDKWQQFTEYAVTRENLHILAAYCDEFLVHGVDVEGKQCGILQDLVELLGEHSPVPVTYAGGVRSLDDLELVHRLGKGKVDVTVGSALDIFGGSLAYDEVVEWHKSMVGL